MVTKEMTVAQLVNMGITLEALQSFVSKELKKTKRQEEKSQRQAEQAKVAVKVLEVLNSDPAKKWKTGQLVAQIFGITKSLDQTKENERYRVHGLVSSSLKDLSGKGSINKVQIGGNSCHTWYQSSLPVPEAEFSDLSEISESNEPEVSDTQPSNDDEDLVSEIIFIEEQLLIDEEDLQADLEDIINND